MPRSEASRQRDRDRVRLWVQNNPERRKKNQRKANTNYAAKRALRPRLDERTAKSLWEDSLSVVTAMTLRRPTYVWMDAEGNTRVERWQDADELLREFRRHAGEQTGKTAQAIHPRKAG